MSIKKQVKKLKRQIKKLRSQISDLCSEQTELGAIGFYAADETYESEENKNSKESR